MGSPSLGAGGSSQSLPAGAGRSALPLAAPPSPPAAAASHVIQRSHAPEVAQPAAPAASGGVIARVAATDGSGGASQNAEAISDDQVEELAGRVYGRIRDRLGAELLRDRERAGLLSDR